MDFPNRIKMEFRIVLSAMLILSCRNLYSQNKPTFVQHVLRLEGDVQDAVCQDLNGDLAEDILVLHNRSRFPEPYAERYLSVFLQKNGLWNERPTQTLHLDHDEIVFDIGNTDGDSICDLFFLKADGVYARKWTTDHYDTALQCILKTPSIFSAPDPNKLCRYTFAQDIDGDAVSELVLPQTHTLCIYAKDSQGTYVLSKSLWISPDIELNTSENLVFSFRLPSFQLKDFNADKTPDLLLLSQDRLDVYIQHENHEGPRNPSSLIPPDLRYRMGARNIHPTALEPLAPTATILETCDLNRDGYVDVLLSKASRAGFTANISQIQIYLNKNGRFDFLPDQILTVENFGSEHVIKDFNGDGLLDLALLTFRIGFAQAAKFFITKKASNAYEFFLMRADNTYAKKPDGKIAFSRAVRIQDIFGSSLCQSFDGDFNGDGFHDFLMGTDTNTISIFPGHPGGFFDSKTVFRISAPLSNRILVKDFNGDGRSDMLLWYPENPNLSKQILIFLSEIGASR